MHCSALLSDRYQRRLRVAAHRSSPSLCISIVCDAVGDSGGWTPRWEANRRLHLETRALMVKLSGSQFGHESQCW